MARIDVAIEQIVFEYQQGDALDKQQQYIRALEKITEQYPSLPAANQGLVSAGRLLY